MAATSHVAAQIAASPVSIKVPEHGISEHLLTQPYVEMSELLISFGANIDAKGWHGRTALHEATILARADLVKFLLSKGADVHAKDDEGNTPLHLIYEEPLVFGQHGLVVQYLLAAGADTKVKNNNGYTPVDIADSADDIEVTELLLSRPAS